MATIAKFKKVSFNIHSTYLKNEATILARRELKDIRQRLLSIKKHSTLKALNENDFGTLYIFTFDYDCKNLLRVRTFIFSFHEITLSFLC